MTLETGTLVLADYTAKLKDTGAIIDTTRKADAEKAGNADPTRTYEPRLIAVGEGWVLKGLDEALKNAEPGQTIDVELAPENAFGARDPNRVSKIPVKKFGEKASELSVGAEVEVDNRVGIVRALESGRAYIDFNHRYAGKTVEYNVDIKTKLDTNDQKVEALIRRRLPLEKEKLKFEFAGDDTIRIAIPSDYFLFEGLQIIKRGISTDLFKYVKPLQKVEFVEDYENPAPKPEAQPKSPDATPATGETAGAPGEAEKGPEPESTKSAEASTASGAESQGSS